MASQRQYPFDRTWRTLLLDLGLRPGDVLRRAALPEDLLVQEKPRVTEAEFLRFWQALGQEREPGSFAIEVVERMSAEAFLPPLFAALCSPDLVAAAERIAEFKQLMGPGGYAVSRPRGGLLRVRAVSSSPLPDTLVLAELATAVKIARMGLRREVQPMLLTLRNPPADVSVCTAYFGVRPTRGRQDALVFRREDAEANFVTDNHGMWRVFAPALQARLSELRGESSTETRVRAALLELLPAGKSSVDEVARRLGVGRRTLQRQLAAEGTRYQQTLGRLREELARHYLEATVQSPAEISFLLGFDDPRSFFRAFRKWTGTSPERFRGSRIGHSSGESPRTS